VKDILGILFLSVVIVACDGVNMNENTSGTSSPQKIRSAELSDFLKVTVVGGDPEKYTVQFSWPQIQDNKILRIRLGSVLTEMHPDQTFFTHQVAHNQVLTYAFDILDITKKPEKTIQKTVFIPMDFVVRQGQDTVTSTRINANRIYLNSSVPLTTNGMNVDITANEIHSVKGTIQSFPEGGSSAIMGSSGASAGKISITAKLIYGKLKFIMRGQDGGEGLKGDPIPGRASAGSSAGKGLEDCTQHPTSNSLVTLNLKPLRVCTCDEVGGAGGPGAPGITGLIGNIGYPGGDTGSLKVVINQYVSHEGSEVTTPAEESAPIIDVIQIPGHGGTGGEGGDGQLGGIGGPTPGGHCDGRPGPEGPRGPSGKRGPTGPDGIQGPKCIYIGSENINECHQ